jgi:chromosome segregation ATPase
VSELSESIASYEFKLNEARESASGDVEEMKRTLKLAQEDANKSGREVRRLSISLQDATTKCEEMEREICVAKLRISELDHLLNTSNLERNEQASEVMAAKEKLRAWEAERLSCSMEADRRIKGLDDENRRLHGEAEQAKVRAETAEHALESLQRNLELEQAKNAELGSRISQIQVMMSESAQRENDLANSERSMAERLRAVEKSAREVLQRLEEKESECDSLNATVASLKENSTEIGMLRSKLDQFATLEAQVERLRRYKSERDDLASRMSQLVPRLERQSAEIEQKDQEIQRLKRDHEQNVRVLKLQRQRVAEFQEEFERESIMKNRWDKATAAVDALYSFLCGIQRGIVNSRQFLNESLRLIQNVFASFSLKSLPFSVVEGPRLDSTGVHYVFSVPPGHSDLAFQLNALRTDLLKFPLDEPIGVKGIGISLTEKILVLRQIVKKIWDLFGEKEKEIERINELVSEQHHTLMQVTKTGSEGSGMRSVESLD